MGPGGGALLSTDVEVLLFALGGSLLLAVERHCFGGTEYGASAYIAAYS